VVDVSERLKGIRNEWKHAAVLFKCEAIKGPHFADVVVNSPE
jgi:hypothetical protein